MALLWRRVGRWGVDVSLNEGLVAKVKAVERGELAVGVGAAEGLG